MRYLLAEDDTEVQHLTLTLLKTEGCAVDTTDKGLTALRLVKSNQYDGMILSRHLRDVDALSIVKQIRQIGITFPIMVFSNITDGEEASRMLLAGADDVIRRPFSYQEVVARLRALNRRRERIYTHELKYDALAIDLDRHLVVRSGHTIYLSKKEFSLMEYFIRHPERVVSRTELLEHVWDAQADPFTNTVEVHVRNLRKKIDTPFQYSLLHTIFGRGYTLSRKAVADPRIHLRKVSRP